MEQDTHLIIEAPSLEEALEEASRRWNVPAGSLRAEVVGEEKTFFGLFGRKLKVRIEPVKSLLLLKSSAFLSDLLAHMELCAEPEFCEEENMIGIEGQDADILVGRHGDGLKAMEYLLNLALRSPGEEPRVRLDSGGYRDRRRKSLERLAEATARRVVQRGAPLRLEPMLSWERWVIHTTLKDRDDVETQSVGESPERKVVVIPKLGAAERRESTRPAGKSGLRRTHYRR